MEKIKQINEILKQYFFIDIFDSDVQKKYNLEKYFTMNITLEELLKSIYKDNIESIIETQVINNVPSRINKLLDLKKPNNELILSLDDLGYENISIKYYIKENNKKIYLGSFKNKIKKYAQPCTKIGYMNKIEETYNITLLPNINHTELIYDKEQILPDEYNNWTSSNPGYFVQADFENYQTVLKDANTYTAIKDSNGNIICKNIECNHKNGYSTDEYLLSNINIKYNYLNNEIDSNLVDIPENIKAMLINQLNLLIAEKQESIINIITLILKEVVDKKNNFIEENFLKNSYYNIPKELFFNYQIMVESSNILNIDIPIIEKNSLENFLKLLNLEKQKYISEYNKKIQDINEKIENEKMYINNNKKILEQAENYMDEVYYCEDPVGYELISYAENLYGEFRDVLLQNKNSIEELKELILKVKEGITNIENVSSKELLHDGDFNVIKDDYLPHHCAKYLVDLIEKNMEYCEKHIKFIPTNDVLIYDLYKYKKEQESIGYKYNSLMFSVRNIIKQLSDYSLVREELNSFITAFEQINLLCGKQVINEGNYEVINLKKELLDNLSNGNLLNENHDNIVGHYNQLILSNNI